MLMAPESLKKTPTIQDVAREAGVSSATVSRALSTPERVSEVTRARISHAVDATGYIINQAARSLRMHEARTILIAMPNIGNPFYSTILDAVVNEATSRGYGVLVANRLGNDPTQWLRHYFSSNRADGMVLFDDSLNLDGLHDLPRQGGMLPLVVSCDELLDADFHVVMTDNRQGAARATRHLIALGHTRIGHLRGRLVHNFPNERWLGFSDAMREAGLAIRPEWVFPGDHSMLAGEAAGEAFAALSHRPSAVFCANDEMMIGFLARIRDHGLDCPRDVSLVGFDDISITENYWPPLTTVRQPRRDLGRVATATLLDILEGTARPSDSLRIVLPSELIIRRSTASPLSPPDNRFGLR
ncbi:MAG TPA: LacI family DNA-binding transcriptional regulator [Devosiaceae bacterium]|jgi:LacI family repressor for deo operon, udp, cdd, tsx, nupC, and nupG